MQIVEFSKLGEPDEAIDGADPGYDIVVDDDVVSNQYGHDSPQIHQVQHIANVETLQQFSPAYPLQPIYRPVVYSHGQGPLFKQNDENAVKTAANDTNTENKTEKTPTDKTEKVDESKIYDSSAKTEQTNRVAETKLESTTETAKLKVTEAVKLAVTETAKLPTPMDQVLKINATTKEV